MDDLAALVSRVHVPVLPTHIDEALSCDTSDPESMTEINSHFYFRTDRQHYFFGIERADMDSAITNSDAAEAYATLVGGFTRKQRRMVDHAPITQRVLKLDYETRRAEVVRLSRSIPIGDLPLSLNTFAGYFTGSSYRFPDWCNSRLYPEERASSSSICEIIEDLKFEEFVDPAPILMDSLPKLKAAIVYWKAKYGH